MPDHRAPEPISSDAVLPPVQPPSAGFIVKLFLIPAVIVVVIVIVFFMAGRGTPPLNDVTPLPVGRKLLGVAAFMLLALILIPMPEGMTSPQAQDMRCPYL